MLGARRFGSGEDHDRCYRVPDAIYYRNAPTCDGARKALDKYKRPCDMLRYLAQARKQLNGLARDLASVA
jgi:hypothetical protein